MIEVSLPDLLRRHPQVCGLRAMSQANARLLHSGRESSRVGWAGGVLGNAVLHNHHDTFALT